MTCIFFFGVRDFTNLNPESLETLHREVGVASQIEPDEVELHFAPFGFTVVRRDGRIESPEEHGVHMFIEWHAGRTVAQKSEIAQALQRFLIANGQGGGADLTFRDSPVGETFFLEGKLVA